MDLTTINRMDHDRFVAAFGAIFEHSPWVAERVHAARPFASVDALHAAMVAAVRKSSREAKLALLRAHPDLAGKQAQEGTMTRDSVAEQASAGLGLLTRAEMDRIAGLNAAYRVKHGFPFIIAVRHYTKAGILHEFNRRLANDSETELHAALEQVAAITRMRITAAIDEDTAPASAGATAT